MSDNAATLNAEADHIEAVVADGNADALDAMGLHADYLAGLIEGNEDEQARVQGEAQILHDLANNVRNGTPVVTAWAELARVVAASA